MEMVIFDFLRLSMFTMFLCTLNVIDFFADSNPFNLWRLKGRVTHVLEGVNDRSVYEKQG